MTPTGAATSTGEAFRPSVRLWTLRRWTPGKVGWTQGPRTPRGRRRRRHKRSYSGVWPLPNTVHSALTRGGRTGGCRRRWQAWTPLACRRALRSGWRERGRGRGAVPSRPKRLRSAPPAPRAVPTAARRSAPGLRVEAGSRGAHSRQRGTPGVVAPRPRGRALTPALGRGRGLGRRWQTPCLGRRRGTGRRRASRFASCDSPLLCIRRR